MFKPIENEKIYKVVMRQLKELIDDGDLSPGDQLPPERELADKLAVSRVSVRQAIAGLEAQGIVANRQGDGTYIVDRGSIHEVIEGFSRLVADEQIGPDQILECRLIVECATTQLCAERATDEEISQIESLLERRREEQGTAASLSEMNRDFHAAIVDGAKNQALGKVMQLLLEMMEYNMWPRLKQMSEERERRIQRHLDQHEAIAQAIKIRDGVTAYERMREHLETIRYEMNLDLSAEGEHVL